MAKFNPSMLVPAQQAPEFSKGGAARTVQQVALDNINRMREQFAAGDRAEGRCNFRAQGGKVAFSIRVSNTALVLGTFEQDGATAEVREMVVPAAHFTEALDYMADRVRAGEFDAQLAALAEKKEGRTTKLRATRAARREGGVVKA